MPVDRGKGTFRLAWVAVSVIGLAALVAASVAGAAGMTAAGPGDGRLRARPRWPLDGPAVRARSRRGSPPRSTSARAAAAQLQFGDGPGRAPRAPRVQACGHIAYVNPRLVVTTLPITEAGEVVLIRRGIEPGMGFWAQPGGFLEVDETVHQAAIRETHEETGPARRAGRDRRAVHAARGGRRDDRVRGADRRRDAGPDARGDRDRDLSARDAIRGRTSPSRRPPGRSATGCACAIPTSRRVPRAASRPDLPPGPQLRSMKTFFVSVYRSSAAIPSSRPMPDIL